jgi:ABC-type antimicrobial peptide transport system permease subunit
MIVINQSLARKLWPKEDPLGKHLRSTNQKPGTEPLWLTVIGVSGDVHQVSLENAARPEIMRPMVDYTNLTLAVRTSQDPQSAISAIQAQIWQLDKDLPVFDVQTMEQILEDNSGERRFNSFLMTTFAALSLLLAGVGIYGVLSSMVGQRTRETGIRLALGAQKKHLFGVVVGQGMRLTAIGLALGLIASAALSRAIASLLYSVSPFDVKTYAAVAAGIGLIALLACYLPAYRATVVHPMEALRHE